VKALEDIKVPLRTKPFDFDADQLRMYEAKGETETFRFINWEDLSEDDITLPIDKMVVKILQDRFSQ
jgi:hypothetical protein